MVNIVHLTVEEGADKGKQITVPPQGARLGRSSKNDIVLQDPVMSRHHCRLFFKDNELWITDLGSANETLVNSKPIQEMRLNVGDSILVGDSTLKVRNDGATLPAAPVAAAATSEKIDLGLKPEKKAASHKKINKNSLIMVALLMVALGAAVWIPKLLKKDDADKNPTPLDEPVVEKTLEIDFEKIIADTENIFRYHLQIDKNNIISIKIDDIKNNRHVRKEKTVNDELIQGLITHINDSGFYDLKEQYYGIKPDVLEQYDITIIIGNRVHRTVVLNREKPELLRALVDDIIEEFGKNELGLEAIQFPPEKLIEMANDSYLLGKKLSDEREIQYGNLALAIKSYTEAQIYLETIEPKPNFYADILSGIKDFRDELEEKHKERDFSAQRSIRLREWKTAADELRIILLMIPNSDDSRHKEARKSLIEIEKRIEAEKE